MSICAEIKQIIGGRLDEILSLRNSRRLKADDSFVTEGDLLCERVIVDHVRRAYPAFDLVTEESIGTHIAIAPGADVIYLDPIDGTENFTSGLREWGISVAVFRGGAHSESLLYLPEMGLSLQSGEVLRRHVSRIQGLSSSLQPENLRLLKPGVEYRIMGCAVYNLYCVIAGSFSSFENPRGARCWDIAAGFNLAREHGLRVTVEGTPYEGELLQPNRKYRFRIQNE